MSTAGQTSGFRGFVGRHKAVTVLVVLLAVLLAVVLGAALYLNSKVSSIPRFDAGLEDTTAGPRPADDPGEGVSILLVGVDDGHGTDLRKALQASTWPKGVFRSDTIAVLHLDSDRKAAQLVSIPRDSYVPIRGYGQTKINAAFSYGGPALLAQTVEQLTQHRIDHVAVIDLEGFIGVTDAVGGVDLKVAGDGSPVHMDGKEALAYVRERKSLPGGDFDRIKRQQNFLRAVLHQSADPAVLGNPLRLSQLVSSVTSHLAVDQGFTNGRVRSLALDSRSAVRNVDYVTVPVAGLDTIKGASVVLLDVSGTRALFQAVGEDRFAQYVKDHPVTELPSPGKVN